MDGDSGPAREGRDVGAVGLDLRAVGRCCSLAWGGLLVAGQMNSP